MPSNFRKSGNGRASRFLSLEQTGGFRVNAFLQRGSVSMVFRHIKSKIPTFEDLNLDKDTLKQFIEAKDGIVWFAEQRDRKSTMACMLVCE